MAKMSWAVEVAEKMEEVWQKGRQMLAQALKTLENGVEEVLSESILEHSRAIDLGHSEAGRCIRSSKRRRISSYCKSSSANARDSTRPSL